MTWLMQKLISSMIEIYWHHADDFNRREEAELMDLKLRQKLDDLGYPDDLTRPATTQQVAPEEPEPIREPGFMEWLFSDFIRLRYEANGTITYRKHWFVLVRAAWLPGLLMLGMLAVVIARVDGQPDFHPSGFSPLWVDRLDVCRFPLDSLSVCGLAE